MEKKGRKSASNHSASNIAGQGSQHTDIDKQKAIQTGVSAIPNPENNQAAADNKMQNKAKAKKTNTIKVSKKGEAANKSGGSMSGKGQTGGQSCIEPNGQKVKKIQDGNNKKRKKNPPCFTGDTLICTDKGYQAIKEIRKGDDIYSRNEKTKETGLKKVTKIFKSVANTIHKIWLDGKERIKTTAYHPIFVKGKGWVNAINLQEGNEIETMEGAAQITRIEKTRHEDPVDVYNLQVEEWETYFVSESQAFVHNCNGNSNLQGVRIINKKYAGKTYKLDGELGKKYPKGVKFTKEGFPDFGPYQIDKVEVEGLVGDASSDFKKALEASKKYDKTPKGYTWHHVEDGKTLILIPTDLHDAVRHTGGAALIRKGIRP